MMFNGIELIQSILLIISAIMILICAIGLIRLDKDMNNVVYGRIHIIGLFDIALIIAFIGLGEIFLAIIYFIIAPITAHAMANAYYYGEDNLNNENLEIVEEDVSENPFKYPISKFNQSTNQDSKNSEKELSEKFTVSTLDISEDE
ncbi:cation:proton antiporter [Methanobrevibacter sp. DSM 116169]|uniref:cation:proton antiporter n=1 Tax=Methanobrevibacter sp. DSM 116169 TaxID=3242727 RepID=UPI0038FCBB61